jgi:hypothetical protein
MIGAAYPYELIFNSKNHFVTRQIVTKWQKFRFMTKRLRAWSARGSASGLETSWKAYRWRGLLRTGCWVLKVCYCKVLITMNKRCNDPAFAGAEVDALRTNFVGFSESPRIYAQTWDDLK